MGHGISLYFLNNTLPCLNETFFSSSDASLKTIRGKTAGAFPGHGTFQWTMAVRALSVLMLETKISGFGSCEGIIRGGRPSLACSLDESINKGTSWLAEMLGCNSGGRLLAKSLILRSNSSLKRAGDVVLRINPKQLQSHDIKIYLDQNELTQEIELLFLKEKLLINNDLSAIHKHSENIAA